MGSCRRLWSGIQNRVALGTSLWGRTLISSTKREHNGINGHSELPPVIDREAWLERMKVARRRINPMADTEPPMRAFYSSLTGAITTDLEMFHVPVDDRAFVRGHALFDTATLDNGRVYRLGIHLDRLFQGAKNARIPMPFPGDEDANRKRMTEIVCATAVASGLQNAEIRYWLSVGPGNFGFTPEGCETSFYCLIFRTFGLPPPGHKEATVRSVPMKPPLLAETKSNNYMLNCLTAMAAQDEGGQFGIMVKPDGNIGEGCGVNCVFVTKDGVLRTPPFANILKGTTVRRVLQLAEKVLVKEKGLLKEVRQEEVPELEAREAVELIMTGGDTHIMPVIEWDGKKVGSGEVGTIAKELIKLLKEEAKSGDEDVIQLKYP
eukprot:gnl/MRDRNA2_/MRDRNA2_33880_c0_seq1.p1 gnl/MRDRNA2_/MRDRNA2_33880_c0~~gnl/MRDRNA2_/MRDRNA2_33880_c0_seq1.p1  ORF type:complete len:378 (+),score=57.95 gnl/MRDRNA2_/MRDRNA2_33880_c0_seq1:104-1237(+)